MGLINGSQIDKSSIALLVSHLITNFMTRQEFLEECKVQLPIHKPDLNKSEIYLLCLNALKEVSKIIGESSSGKLLSKDRLPNITGNTLNFSSKEKKEEKYIIGGYKRLFDQVVDIFYNDLYFDEDLLEDNDLISDSLKELAINETSNSSNNNSKKLKERSTPTKYSKIKYPEQVYPLAVEVLLTLDYDDLVIWKSLPLLLQIHILNNYILYLLIEKKLSYSKFENHKLFVNAFVSSMNAPEKLEIPSDEGIREARMELCKLGILYKPGIDIEPFKTLFSVPKHSLDLWKKLPLELQLELLVAFIYSIRNNIDLELNNKYLFYNLRKNKFPDGIQSIVKQYLLKKFIIEESNIELAYQHFRKILFYAYKVGMKDLEHKNLEDTAIILQDPFAILQKTNIPNNSEIKEEEAISIAEAEVEKSIGDTPIDLKKETKSETLINKKMNKNSKEVKLILKKPSKFITVDKNNIYSKIENPQKTLPEKAEQKLETTLLKGFNKGKIIKSTNLLGAVKSNFQERPDLRIIPVHDIKSNGLKIVDVSGFSVIPSTAQSLSYNPKEGSWIINTENNQFEKDSELNDEKTVTSSDNKELNEDKGETEDNNVEMKDNEGFNNEGFNNEGFNNEGFNNEGFNNEGFNNEGEQNEDNNVKMKNNEGFNNEGEQNEGFNNEREQNEGFNNEGEQNEDNNVKMKNNEGFNNEGEQNEEFNNEEFNNEGFNNEGEQNEGFNNEREQNEGFNNEGEQNEDNNVKMKNNEGFNNEGEQNEEFNNEEFNNEGFNNEGEQNEGFNNEGEQNEGFNNEGEQNEDNNVKMKNNEGFSNYGGQNGDNNLEMKENKEFGNYGEQSRNNDLEIKENEGFINDEEQNGDNNVEMRENKKFGNYGEQIDDNDEIGVKENEGFDEDKEQNRDNYLGIKENGKFHEYKGQYGNNDSEIGIKGNEGFDEYKKLFEDNKIEIKENEGFIEDGGQSGDNNVETEIKESEGFNENKKLSEYNDDEKKIKGNEEFGENEGQNRNNDGETKIQENKEFNEDRRQNGDNDNEKEIQENEEFGENEVQNRNNDDETEIKESEGFNENKKLFEYSDNGIKIKDNESSENEEQNEDNDDKVGINETGRFDETYKDNYEKFGDHKYEGNRELEMYNRDEFNIYKHVGNKGQTEIEGENEKELGNNIREEELGEDNKKITNRKNFIIEDESDKEKFKDSNIESENLETNSEGREFNSNAKEELNENNEKTLKKDFIIEDEDNENVGELGEDKEAKDRHFGIDNEEERDSDKNLARELIKDSKVDDREDSGKSNGDREFIDNNGDQLYNNKIENEGYLKGGNEVDQKDGYDKSSNSKEKLSEYEEIENGEHFRSDNENNKGVLDNSNEEIKNKNFEVESKDGESLANNNLDKELENDFTGDREKIGLDSDNHEDEGLKNNQEEKFVGNDVVHEKELFGSDNKEDKEDKNKELANNYIERGSRTHEKDFEDDDEETTGKEDKILYEWDDLNNKATRIDGDQKAIGSSDKSTDKYVNDRETRELDAEDLDFIEHENKEYDQTMNQEEYQNKSGQYKQEENINKEDDDKLKLKDQLETEDNNGIGEFGESNMNTEKDGFLVASRNEKIHDDLEYVNQNAGIGDIESNNNEYHNQITQIVNETPKNGDIFMSDETDLAEYEPAFENEKNKYLNMDDMQSIVDTEEITEYLPEKNALNTKNSQINDDLLHNEEGRNVDKDELESSKFNNNGILKKIYETKDKRETGYIGEQGKEGIKNIQDNGFLEKVDDSLKPGYDNENLTSESHENSIISDIGHEETGIENVIPEIGYNTNSLDNGGKIKEISIDKNTPSGSFVEKSSQGVIYDMPNGQNKMSDVSIIYDSTPFQDLDLEIVINLTKEKQKRTKEMINETERHIKSIELVESESVVESIKNEISQVRDKQKVIKELINETKKQIKPLELIESNSLTKSIENEISQVRDKQKVIKELINETEKQIKPLELIESKSVVESIKNAISQLKNEQENTKEMINETEKQIKPLELIESNSLTKSIENEISQVRDKQKVIKEMINETERHIKSIEPIESESVVESIKNEISQVRDKQKVIKELINETKKQIKPLELIESNSLTKSIENEISQVRDKQKVIKELINETEKQIKPL
ncbi:hypothetical protein ACR3K2_37240, partial [Cryptosporidium serpentis]